MKPEPSWPMKVNDSHKPRLRGKAGASDERARCPQGRWLRPWLARPLRGEAARPPLSEYGEAQHLGLQKR